MGIFSRRPKTASTSPTSPYGCEQAMESTSSFGSISCTPGAASRAFLPFTDEPEPVSADSTLSAATYSAYNLPALLASQSSSAGPASPAPDPRTRSRSRPRLHASASHHNLHATAAGLHPRPPPPLPALPPHLPHTLSASYSRPAPPRAFNYHYLPTKSSPNLLEPAFLPKNHSSHMSLNTNANTSQASPRRGLGSNKEASASRVSLANVASAGRSLARVPSLWKTKFRRSQNSTNSDTSDSSTDSKSPKWS